MILDKSLVHQIKIERISTIFLLGRSVKITEKNTICIHGLPKRETEGGGGGINPCKSLMELTIRLWFSMPFSCTPPPLRALPQIYAF